MIEAAGVIGQSTCVFPTYDVAEDNAEAPHNKGERTMKLSTWAARIAGVTVFALSAVSSAQAASVTFTNINDALPSRCYDSSLTEPDSTNPNRLVIGIKTGVALVNSEFGGQYLERGCVASTASFYPKNTMDTISLLVQAPAGF